MNLTRWITFSAPGREPEKARPLLNDAGLVVGAVNGLGDSVQFHRLHEFFWGGHGLVTIDWGSLTPHKDLGGL